MSYDTLSDAVNGFKADADRVDTFTNGGPSDSYSTTDGRDVPSVAKFLADKDSEINQSADGILAGATAAATSASGSASSATNSAASAASSALAASTAIPPVLVTDYTAFRAYSGTASALQVTGLRVSAKPLGIAGSFIRDDFATSVVDDGGTVIITTGGKVFRRVFSGAASPLFWGCAGDGATLDDGAFTTLESGYKNKPVDLQGRVYAVSAIPTQNSYRNGGFNVGGKIRWTHESTSFFGRNGSCNYYGGQLRALAAAIADPLTQLLSVTFVGDSITWGIGTSGTEATDPRNGTLGDPRDNSLTGSYVNNMKRWFAQTLGPSYGVTTTNTDWPYATSGAGNGACITTHQRAIDLGFLDTGPFTYAVSGGAAHSLAASATSIAGAQRRFSVPQGALGSISFNMTGEQFTFVFDGTNSSDRYNVYINGMLLAGSPFDMNASRIGQPNPFYNFKRNHAFPFARNATVKIEFVAPADGTSTSSVYAGALEIPKQIRVKNQGISGATTRSYLTYNFPTSKLQFPPLQKVKSGFGATITAGSSGGPVSETDVTTASSATGEQIQLDMYGGGTYSVTCPIPAGADSLLIGFSGLGNGATVNVLNGATVIDTFSSVTPSPAFQQQHLVRFPAGAASLTLQTLPSASAHIAFYMEGLVAFQYASASAYPTNNGYGKGVAVESRDSFCFIQLGTNDRIAAAAPQYPTPATVSNYLSQMLALMPDGCLPIIMVANAALNDGPPTYWGSMLDIRNILKCLAKSSSVDFIDNLEMFQGAPVSQFTADGLHPNELGHRLMSSNIIDAINRA
ncbi:hypothetical protein G3O00_01870 [Burkholderia sp. Ac-20384]|uniref:SGNH/GDSL hydrolase family protein n=1 Tax=Burkholderia sp. Ac-20384 TaxID=2703902 RepID=UPI00197E83B2|nr:SGNH/GDSL hydrolase family protein [Burkholderia sp. Ac-20384]MBN3822364.1 hypothetical protein [Burkholderia sp. Ac-20384]